MYIYIICIYIFLYLCFFALRPLEFETTVLEGHGTQSQKTADIKVKKHSLHQATQNILQHPTQKKYWGKSLLQNFVKLSVHFFGGRPGFRLGWDTKFCRQFSWGHHINTCWGQTLSLAILVARAYRFFRKLFTPGFNRLTQQSCLDAVRHAGHCKPPIPTLDSDPSNNGPRHPAL